MTDSRTVAATAAARLSLMTLPYQRSAQRKPLDVALVANKKKTTSLTRTQEENVLSLVRESVSDSNSATMLKRFNSLWLSATTSSNKTNDVAKREVTAPGSEFLTVNHNGDETALPSGAELTRNSLLFGQLNNLPPISTNVVKIYISCNESEFRVERQLLMQDILPKLRAHFLKDEINIQFIDGHIGQPFEYHLDGHAALLHRDVIRDCHRTSVGPFFLCFLGNKYGAVPLPATIERTEYKHVHQEAFEAGKDIKLMEKWYTLDERHEPPSYVLQPISRQYSHLAAIPLDSDRMSREAAEVELRDWCHVKRQLSDIMQHAATVCRKEDRMSAHRFNKYVHSAVHQELDLALALDSSRTIVINRTFHDITVDDIAADDYTDTITTGGDRKIDRQLQNQLQTLVKALPWQQQADDVNSSSRPTCHAVPAISWSADGLQPDTVSEHTMYVQEFRRVVYSTLRRAIQHGVSNHLRAGAGRDNETLKLVDREVVTCLYSEQAKRRKLEPRPSIKLGQRHCDPEVKVSDEVHDALIRAVDEDMQSEGGHHAILILGPEGSGKSTTLLHAIEVITGLATSPDDVIVVPRLVQGVGRTSADLLCGLVVHLSHVYALLSGDQQTISQSPSPNGVFDRLTQVFHNLLRQLSESLVASGRRLVIAIDGLENVRSSSPPLSDGSSTTSASNLSGSLDWLMAALPASVHVFLTSRTSFEYASNATTSPLPHAKSSGKLRTVEIPELTKSEISAIVDETFRKLRRRVPADVTSLVAVAIAHPRPLFVRLVAEEWAQCDATPSVGGRSASANGTCTTDKLTSFEAVAKQRFKRIERLHGKSVVSWVLRYLSSSLRGLTECELLDVMSCNDVISELTSATNGRLDVDSGKRSLRFPCTVWHNVRKALGNMLVERMMDNHLLLTWCCRSVSQAASRRYRRQVDDTKLGHRDLANLFLETWLAGRLPGHYLDLYRYNDDVTVESVLNHGCRHVSAQPLLLSTTTYNLRRISELWFQLLNAGDLDLLKNHAWCNYEYLLARLHSSSVYALINDLDLTSASALDPDIHLVLHSVIASVRVLAVDPLQLASELIGRLRPLKDSYQSHIEPLVQQCIEWCDSYKLPLVVPLTSWLEDPRPPLVTVVSEAKSTVRLCPTGSAQHVFCADAGHVINMYHVPSSKQVRSFTGHVDKVTCMEIAHGSLSLWSGSLDGSLREWDVTTGKQCYIVSDPDDAAILCMKLTQSGSLLIVGSQSGNIHTVDTQTSDIEQTMSMAHRLAINCLVVNSSDTVVATGSEDCSIKTWFIDDLSLLAVMDTDIPAGVNRMALTSDNTFLVVGCVDNSIHVRSFISGNFCHQLRHRNTVQALAVSSDCVRCIVASVDGTLYVYNLRNADILFTLSSGDAKTISDVRLSSDDRFIFSSTEDSVRVWTFQQQQERTVHQSNEHTKPVTCIKLSDDGKMAVTGSDDGLVKLWDLEISDFKSNLKRHTGPVTCVDISADDAFVASGSTDAAVIVWSVTMTCVITEYREHQSPLKCLYVLNDNMTVLSAEVSGLMKLWEAEHGVTKLSISGPVGNLQLTLNCQLAVSGDSNENSVKLWRVMDGLPIQSINHVGCITCACFSPDAQYLVTGSEDMSLKVWEAATGKLTQVLVEHEDVVSCVAVATGTQLIVSGSHDKRLMIWSLDTGEVEHQLIGHTDHVTAVKITKDGTIAISGSRDETIRVWNVLHGTIVTLFDIHQPIADIVATSDARRIAIRLAASCHVPFLCLHNSPTLETSEVKSRSQVQLSIVGDGTQLPLTPRFVADFNDDAIWDNDDVSTIAQQLQPPSPSDGLQTYPFQTKLQKNSPAKAPLQTAVRAQEINKSKHRFDKESSYSAGASTENVNQHNKKVSTEKLSSVCTVL